MNKDDLIDKIARGDKLSAAEQKLWNEIKDEPEVIEKLEFLKELEAPLRVENRNQLKDQLIHIESKIDNTKVVQLEPDQNLIEPTLQNNQSKVFNIKWLYAAAGILLLGAVTYLMFPKQTAQNYFVNYYETYPSIVHPIVKGNNEAEKKSEQGFVAYQNEQYQSAIELFELSPKSNDTIQFYKAISHIELNQLDEAKTILEEMKQRENRFKNEASWYEALCLVKEGNTIKAGLILSNIAYTKDHPYASEAEDLFNKIK